MLAAVFLVIACVGGVPRVVAATHVHAVPATPATHPAAHATTGSRAAETGGSVAAAKRFVADAPLREGMAGIRRSVLALDHARHGHLDAAQVRSLAAAIRADANAIIAKCALAPDADAALHPILGTLLNEAAALERDPAKPAAAIDGLQAALRDFARRFDEGAPG
jgi:hypothetical protein